MCCEDLLLASSTAVAVDSGDEGYGSVVVLEKDSATKLLVIHITHGLLNVSYILSEMLPV